MKSWDPARVRFANEPVNRLPALRSVSMIAAASLVWLFLFNLPVLSRVIEAGAHPSEARTAALLVALAVLVVALHGLILGVLGVRSLLRPAIASLTLVAAGAAHFIDAYGVMLDPSMLRNVLATHPAEALELLTANFAFDLVVKGVLPAMIFLRWPVRVLPWRQALLERAALLVSALGVIVITVWVFYQPLSSLMRNQRELRYLITPVNVLWSGGVALSAQSQLAIAPRAPIGLDAKPGESWAGRQRPLVVVMVVGETARAANWGLNPGARETTPELRQLPVINFSQVQSCGTNTEVSVPCMFAPVGRRDYDERRIRSQESLLHVLQRAGVQVHWLDNQSGCKGVCDELPNAFVKDRVQGGCPPGGCLDDRLLDGFSDRLANAQGTHLWVLHMLGNHGPSYFRRYPQSFEHFKPACREDDLHHCSVEAVGNAYDNALRFTDHVLAQTIASLRRVADRVDSALIFVSDHGESLGEKGLFLHGIPYRIAPVEQTRVPMVWWLSPGLDAAIGTPFGCVDRELRRVSATPVAHDHLFHSLLGLLDVRTALREPTLDLLAGCRSS